MQRSEILRTFAGISVNGWPRDNVIVVMRISGHRDHDIMFLHEIVP